MTHTADLSAEQIVGRQWRAHAADTGTVEALAVDVIQGYVILDVDGERVAFTDAEIIAEISVEATTVELEPYPPLDPNHLDDPREDMND